MKTNNASLPTTVKMNILNYHVNTIFPKYPFKKKILINTINPHSYCVAKRDNYFHEALKRTDLLIPDGIGIVLAGKILYRQNIQRIAGADMHSHLLAEAQKFGLRVFYLGASQETLQKIENRINKEYPSVDVSHYSPPFKAIHTREEESAMVQAVNQFAPEILFLGMTAPKQEKFAFRYKESLNTNVICSIGAVFDFFAGSVKRAPKWIQAVGMEWVFRSVMDPKRLGLRNIKSNPEFLVDLLKFKKKQQRCELQ